MSSHAPQPSAMPIAGLSRLMRPVYVDRLPPCNEACPAGENVQGWLADAQAGRYRAAWDTLVRDNPLPAVHGRVCYHPCEEVCNRRGIDAAVSVHAVERFVGDLALREGWGFEPVRARSGLRVLIVGAGPAGLSAAYHLTRFGHAATILEAGPAAGGMMHFGIPKYRLPREVLDAEIRRIEDLGVTIVLNHAVTDLLAEQQAGAYDAVFVAAGAHVSKRQAIPSRDAGCIVDALQFLKAVGQGSGVPAIGRRVAVYGGGNTAIDTARTVRRLGAEPVIIYRRTRARMPAHAVEAEGALEEGVEFRWLRAITAIDAGTMTVEVMELDDRGLPRPTGRFETLAADSLVLALGQDTDSSFLRSVPGIAFRDDGTVVVGPDLMTGCQGIFAGGDMVPGERTVTIAVGHGKRAARHIDAWLRGRAAGARPKHDVVSASMLHLWYDATAPPAAQPLLDPARRRSTFQEVVQGLDAESAQYEAQRCFSCGNCFECDGCLSACAEGAVIKLGAGRRYAFDLSRCTGCAVCFAQCPCAAITMVPEPAAAVRGGTPCEGAR